MLKGNFGLNRTTSHLNPTPVRVEAPKVVAESAAWEMDEERTKKRGFPASYDSHREHFSGDETRKKTEVGSGSNKKKG